MDLIFGHRCHAGTLRAPPRDSTSGGRREGRTGRPEGQRLYLFHVTEGGRGELRNMNEERDVGRVDVRPQKQTK